MMSQNQGFMKRNTYINNNRIVNNDTAFRNGEVHLNNMHQVLNAIAQNNGGVSTASQARNNIIKQSASSNNTIYITNKTNKQVSPILKQKQDTINSMRSLKQVNPFKK